MSWIRRHRRRSRRFLRTCWRRSVRSRDLQEQWRTKEREWSEGRDQLQSLSEELQGLDRRSRDYMQKYEQFGDLEQQVNRLDSEKVALFEQFTGLQESVAARVDSFRIARDSWEESTYADYFDIERRSSGPTRPRCWPTRPAPTAP